MNVVTARQIGIEGDREVFVRARQDGLMRRNSLQERKSVTVMSFTATVL
jgi:hypothetical protein